MFSSSPPKIFFSEKPWCPLLLPKSPFSYFTAFLPLRWSWSDCSHAHLWSWSVSHVTPRHPCHPVVFLVWPMSPPVTMCHLLVSPGLSHVTLCHPMPPFDVPWCLPTCPMPPRVISWCLLVWPMSPPVTPCHLLVSPGSPCPTPCHHARATPVMRVPQRPNRGGRRGQRETRGATWVTRGGGTPCHLTRDRGVGLSLSSPSTSWPPPRGHSAGVGTSWVTLCHPPVVGHREEEPE